MPERPDLEYIVPILRERLLETTLLTTEVHSPVVMRTMVRGDPNDLLAGQVIHLIQRQGHFITFALEGRFPLTMAVHLMLSGRFKVSSRPSGKPRSLAVRWSLSTGDSLELLDDHKMAKVYLFKPSEEASVPQLGVVGVDVLGDEFTLDVLRSIAKKRRDQLKVFLLDKSALDSFGNAYADEVCHAAGLHPKSWVRRLGDEQLADLHRAMRSVLTDARAQVQRRAPALHEKARDFLKVRHRGGEPCARCGTKIRTCGVRGHDAFYCPSCQTDRRGTGLVNWR